MFRFLRQTTQTVLNWRATKMWQRPSCLQREADAFLVVSNLLPLSSLLSRCPYERLRTSPSLRPSRTHISPIYNCHVRRSASSFPSTIEQSQSTLRACAIAKHVAGVCTGSCRKAVDSRASKRAKLRYFSAPLKKDQSRLIKFSSQWLVGDNWTPKTKARTADCLQCDNHE